VTFLLDEMLPPAAAELLRERHGHEAIHVTEVGLGASEDDVIVEFARQNEHVIATENVADFSAERDLAVVCVRKRNLPAGGGQAAALAELLDRWANDHPGPYLGQHWPR
jgi:predicted nuclease of predicted toxin-antitoxin system